LAPWKINNAICCYSPKEPKSKSAPVTASILQCRNNPTWLSWATPMQIHFSLNFALHCLMWPHHCTCFGNIEHLYSTLCHCKLESMSFLRLICIAKIFEQNFCDCATSTLLTLFTLGNAATNKHCLHWRRLRDKAGDNDSSSDMKHYLHWPPWAMRHR